MPLKHGKSDKTRSENIAKEVKAIKKKHPEKPIKDVVKQAAKIGYVVQEEAEKHDKYKKKGK